MTGGRIEMDDLSKEIGDYLSSPREYIGFDLNTAEGRLDYEAWVRSRNRPKVLEFKEDDA